MNKQSRSSLLSKLLLPRQGKLKPAPSQALVFIVLIFLVNYVFFRTVYLCYAICSPFERVLAILFLGSEFFIMFHAIGYYFNVLRLNRAPDNYPVQDLIDEPSVAILIPARHEPREVVEKTLLACYNLDYKNKTVYLLDDSTLEKYKQEARELAQEFSAKVFSRDVHRGAKAGIINDVNKTIKEQYIAVFDADQNPMPHFLKILVPILESNEKLAFVQTPQFYTNCSSNRVSLTANFQQAIFYEYICEGKNTNGTMMCCGTNVLLRRQALMDVSGFDENTVTEDFATSLKLHMKGWKTLYVNMPLVFGMAPEDLVEYFKQQSRWSLGNTQVFKNVIKSFVTRPLSLSFMQWFDYFITGTYYFIGWAYLTLFLCQLIYTFFNVPAFFMNPYVYSLSFLPYFLLALGVFYSSMGLRHYKFSNILKTHLLTMLSVPIYLRATLFGLFNVPVGFQVTNKTGATQVPYTFLWVQIFLWSLNLVAMTWGILRWVYEQNPGILFNVFWLFYHALVFSSIFFFNETGNTQEIAEAL
jgi:cellulose synthase (UDP-forming)